MGKWPEVVPASTVTGATVHHTDLFAAVVEIPGVDDGSKAPVGAAKAAS